MERGIFFRQIEAAFLRFSLRRAIDAGKPEKVAILSQRLGISPIETATNLISSYEVLECRAKKIGDQNQVEKIRGIIHQTQGRAFLPESS